MRNYIHAFTIRILKTTIIQHAHYTVVCSELRVLTSGLIEFAVPLFIPCELVVVILVSNCNSILPLGWSILAGYWQLVEVPRSSSQMQLYHPWSLGWWLHSCAEQPGWLAVKGGGERMAPW